jgi:hypothetical protein
VVASALFKDLPKPKDHHLTLYVLGPGFGESQLVSLPDGKWLVVDSFVHNGQALTARLLTYLGVRAIDLLVVTHADLDHVGGVDTLISTFDVRQLWRYPGAGTLGDLLPLLVERSSKPERMHHLQKAFAAIDKLHEENRAHEVGVKTLPWVGREYEVAPIAPTPHDLHAYRAGLNEALVEWKRGKPQLAEKLVAFLLGEPRRLTPPANRLSVALSIGWKQHQSLRHRLLLGGDVESPSDSRSGWRGALDILREDGREHLVQDVTAIKVSHHGSDGAFCQGAWALHAGRGRVKHALVTPFSRGSNPPPHSDAIQKMSGYCNHLGLTSRSRLPLPPKGWKDAGHKRRSARAPCIAIVMAPNGGTYVHLSQDTSYYTRALTR